MTKLRLTPSLAKKICLSIGTAIALLMLLNPHHAKAQGYDWDIKDFNTEIISQEDGTLNITETITADFTHEQHHGIIRTIPYKYQDQNFQTYNLRIKVNSVKNENGAPHQYSTKTSGGYIKIQIGDPDVYVNKATTYKINYEVKRAITAQQDHEEIYWNSTGTEWDVPIQNASATITLPQNTQQQQIKGICYTGTRGSQEQNCQFTTTGNIVTFQTTTALNAGEGLTFAVSIPLNTFVPTPISQQIIWFLTDNWPYVIPFIVFAVLIYFWQTRGRDPHTGKETIMPIYKPPNGLTPAEAGTIIDERADMHDLSATIIDLAVRGFLAVKELKTKGLLFTAKDYEFTLIKSFENDPTLKNFEKETLRGIFDTDQINKTKKLSELRNSFYKNLKEIKDKLYKGLVTDGYFPVNPEKVRSTYNTIGGILVFIPFFFGIGLIPLSYIIAIITSGIFIFSFGFIMPAKTKKGVITLYQIKGLEEFIKTAEKDRLKWQEQENIFEQLLPYAMSFKLADKWATAFSGIYKNPPSWYSSTDPNFRTNFNTIYFMNAMTSFNNDLNSTLPSSPRSSGGSGFGGGGFSGGGFGGGGGSSW